MNDFNDRYNDLFRQMLNAPVQHIMEEQERLLKNITNMSSLALGDVGTGAALKALGQQPDFEKLLRSVNDISLGAAAALEPSYSFEKYVAELEKSFTVPSDVLNDIVNKQRVIESEVASYLDNISNLALPQLSADYFQEQLNNAVNADIERLTTFQDSWLNASAVLKSITDISQQQIVDAAESIFNTLPRSYLDATVELPRSRGTKTTQVEFVSLRDIQSRLRVLTFDQLVVVLTLLLTFISAVIACHTDEVATEQLEVANKSLTVQEESLAIQKEQNQREQSSAKTSKKTGSAHRHSKGSQRKHPRDDSHFA